MKKTTVILFSILVLVLSLSLPAYAVNDGNKINWLDIDIPADLESFFNKEDNPYESILFYYYEKPNWLYIYAERLDGPDDGFVFDLSTEKRLGYTGVSYVNDCFFVVSDGEYRALADNSGQLLTGFDYINITSAGQDVIEMKRSEGALLYYDCLSGEMFEYDGYLIYSEGLSSTRIGRKVGVINRTGQLVVPNEYDKIGRFSGGLAPAAKDGQYGVIDGHGRIVAPFVFDYIGEYSDGRAVMESGGKFGFIDEKGDVVIAEEYDEAHDFHNGIAIVRLGDCYGVIDRFGDMVIPTEYLSFETEFNDSGLAIVTAHSDTNNTKQGVVNAKGEMILPLDTYEKVEFISDNQFSEEDGEYICVIAKTGKCALYDSSGRTIFDYGQYDHILAVSDHSAIVVNGSKYSLVSLSGQELVPFGEYNFDWQFFHGTCHVFDVGYGYGLLDDRGNILLSPKYYYLCTSCSDYDVESYGRYYIVVDNGQIGLLKNPNIESILPDLPKEDPEDLGEKESSDSISKGQEAEIEIPPWVIPILFVGAFLVLGAIVIAVVVSVRILIKKPELEELSQEPPTRSNSNAYCTNCGKPIEKGAKFCSNCGNKL